MFQPRLAYLLVSSILTLHSCCSAMAQSTVEPGSADTVIHTTSNLVLVDVVVTDKGKAIHNLERSQFHVFEDGHEQTITSFDEHDDTAAPSVTPRPAMIPASLPANTYSNFSADQVASAANVLLLDELNTPQLDREFMRQQMIEYLRAVRPGTMIAVFTLTTELRMVQGFTGDASQAIKALEPALESAAKFRELVLAAVAADVSRGGERDPPTDPAVIFAGMLQLLETDPLWAREYEDFVRQVSFARPSEIAGFADALAACKRLITNEVLEG